MNKSFTAAEPVTVDLVVQVGEVELTALPGARDIRVTVTGDEAYADAFTVELRGSVLQVHAPAEGAFPRLGGAGISVGPFRFSRGPRARVEVSVPADSSLHVTNGAANIRADGRWSEGRATGGSGDVTLPEVESVQLESGSGDVTIDRVRGDANLRARSGEVTLGSVGGTLLVTTGSGDVRVAGTVDGDATIQTGSGDISLDHVAGTLTATAGSGDLDVVDAGSTANLRTASGEITVQATHGDVQASAASGDVELRRVGAGECSVRTASGDVTVRVAARIPVWTDVRSISGDVDNRITPVGEPEPGEPTIRLNVQTASGDIALRTAD